MYTTPLCGYCAAARRLLNDKHVDFEEIDIYMDPARRAEMIERSGRRTVPQIFIGDTHVGGFDDLNALEHRGELDPLLERVLGPAETRGD
jgi:glutaredoxin 3